MQHATSASTLAAALLALAACGADDSRAADAGDGTGGDPNTGGNGNTGANAEKYGDMHSGQYHLGPVDFAESAYHNACAPGTGYRSELRGETGLGNELLAGVANEHAANGNVCDACIRIETKTGRSLVARVVTYGVEQDPGDIDVSPTVYAMLNSDEFPRAMSWQFTECPTTGTLRYEFQPGANVWWTSFWVRNPRVPIARVEVKSANHADFFELRREGDGTLNDDGGFGEGEFTLRITGMDGQVVTDTFASFTPGELLVSKQQFK